MTFKVQDLTIKATSADAGDTCGGVTRITGCIADSICLAANASAASRNLSALRRQLRKTIDRA